MVRWVVYALTIYHINVSASGYLLLQEGDMLWVRDKLGDGDPAKDGVRFFYAGRSVPNLRVVIMKALTPF